MPYVTVIGAAHMDQNAKTFRRIIPHDSNPGVSTLSPGGVGRNIAENLARLGAEVKLIAAVGNDPEGVRVLDSCRAVGIDVGHCQVQAGVSTSRYIAILDADGEMHVALMDDSCMITPAHVFAQSAVIGESGVIVLDVNLDPCILTHILDEFSNHDIYIDPISVTKTEKLRPFVGRFHTIKLNNLEAAALTGFAIGDEASLRRAGDYFLAAGTQRVVISLGVEGLYYRTREAEIRLKSEPLVPKNASGAGDALMAGLVYCSLMGKPATYTAEFSQAVAHFALMSDLTVSREITAAAIETHMRGV